MQINVCLLKPVWLLAVIFRSSSIKLSGTDHTAAAYKKCQSRLYLLRKLRSFGVQEAPLTTFCDSVVASAIFYGVVCWSSSISAAGRRRPDKLIKRASSILGCPLDPVQVVWESRMMDKLSSLLVQESRPLQVTVTALGSSFSNRLIHPKCVKERYHRSFLPAAVRLYNQHCAIQLHGLHYLVNF